MGAVSHTRQPAAKSALVESTIPNVSTLKGPKERQTLRLVVYNIRYATGTGPTFHLPLPGAGYLRPNRRVLTGITEFLRDEKPDVVGLIEVDTGSVRSGMVNQAEHI